MKKIIIRNSLILLMVHFGEWAINAFSPFPENIPPTNIRINGLILIAGILTVLIINHRQMLRLDPGISIFKLTIAGALVCLFSEIAFQLARQLTMFELTISERLFFFGLGTLGVTALTIGPSFLVAFQLKTKNTSLSVILIVVFIVLMGLLLNQLGY